MNTKESFHFTSMFIQIMSHLLPSSRLLLLKNCICIVAITIGTGIAMIPMVSRAESFAIKTGQWEVKTTIVTEGMLMTKEVLNSLPPDRRAKVEQQLLAGSAKPKTMTTNECITKEDVNHGNIFKAENPNCKRKVISQSANNLEFEETCPPPEAMKTHFRVEAKSTESFVGYSDVSRSEGKVHVDMSGKWLAAVCKKGNDN